MTQHRDHQSLASAHGHAHIVVIPVDDVRAADFGVDGGHELQGVYGGFDEERHQAQLGPVLFLEGGAELAPQGHHGRHIDLVEGGQERGGLLGLEQTCGDAPAEQAHGDYFFLAAGGGRGRRCFDVPKDVLFEQPAAGAGGGDLVGLEVVLGQEAACGRHNLWCRGAFFDIADDIADLASLAIFLQHLGQAAGHRGRQLHRRLVGLDLDHHLVALDAVAFVFQPAADLDFGNRLP